MAENSLKSLIVLTAFVIAGAWPGFAQTAPNRYALILVDPPVSTRPAARGTVRSAQALGYRQQVESRQRVLRSQLASRNIRVTGSASTLLNAVFVIAPKDRVPELQGLAGVRAVVPLRRYERSLNRALPLVNGPAAWAALNGVENAGLGIKIAILDSGIDQTHAAFQDNSLPIPAGFPMCSGFTGDCGAFTNNKVIVARSYVSALAAGSLGNPAADSRPDDYTPRDRDGHGTAVASCAAGVTSTGSVTITGVAPKAYLGNYKIYGSPEVNDSTFDDVIVQAAEDAVNDGMNVISFSSGGPAFTGPLDTGAACGNPVGVACSLVTQVFENAAAAGVVVVAAAGNSGFDGAYSPTYNSVGSPGDAPSVIAAGATTNAHIFLETVSAPGTALQNLSTASSDAYAPLGALTAPLVDVTSTGDNGLACGALPDRSLAGAIALILRGTCTFFVKMLNAENAGAVGVIFYMADSSPLQGPGGLSTFFIPAVMISNADGLSLKSYVAGSPRAAVTIDPSGVELNLSADFANLLAGFSSYGPSTGDSAVKPDLVAVGTSMYMAAEDYDPLGALYSSNRYAAADGTSFATPLTSGAAALVLQSHPHFGVDQVRSALINTASQDVTTDDSGNPVDVRGTGGGKLDVLAAIGTTVTSTPATLSFGVLTAGSLPKTQQLTLTNSGAGAVTLAITVVSNNSAAPVPAVDKPSLTLAGGASDTVTVTLEGAVPAAAFYSGAITAQAAGVSLRIPYLYLVGSGTADNIIPLTGASFDGTVGQVIPDGVISFKLIDASGVPVAGAPVTWTASPGAVIQNSNSTTDAYGIAFAEPILGLRATTYTFTATAGGLSTSFSGSARPVPTIFARGVINAANGDPAAAVAPGSYVSIYGSGLSDVSDIAPDTRLPMAVDYVNVSFDTANLSVPGHLTYVSSGQVNVQVPWELQGQTAAQVKVTIDYSNGNVVTVPLAAYSPAFFEISPGVVAALDFPGNQVIDASNPVHAGQPAQLFANGLGPVTNQPLSGEPALAVPLSETTGAKPVVTIGGQNANVMFSGLAPGFAGLYQVNVTVPGTLSPGTYQVILSIGGRTSRASNITVQ